MNANSKRTFWAIAAFALLSSYAQAEIRCVATQMSAPYVQTVFQIEKQFNGKSESDFTYSQTLSEKGENLQAADEIRAQGNYPIVPISDELAIKINETQSRGAKNPHAFEMQILKKQTLQLGSTASSELKAIKKVNSSSDDHGRTNAAVVQIAGLSLFCKRI